MKWRALIFLAAGLPLVSAQLQPVPQDFFPSVPLTDPDRKPATNVPPEKLALLKAEAEKGDTGALLELSRLTDSDIEAFGYLKKAAEAGDPFAAFEVSKRLAGGRGVAPDLTAAREWLTTAAKKDHRPAQVALGIEMLQSGTGERAMAFEWLNMARGAGFAPAAIRLARIHARGEFEETVDEAKAEEILIPFAEAGDTESQVALASLYYFGESFAEKRADALTWLEKANASGNPEAGRILDLLKTQAKSSPEVAE